MPVSAGRRLGPAWRLAGLLPLPVLLGAAIGEGVSLVMGGGLRGAGALAGAAVAAAVTPLTAWLAWRLLPREAAPAATATDVAATRDQLTGAFTQRHFVAAADREWARIRRHGEDAALLMVDADQFRELNDKHGQACGDAVLVEITRQASATLRQYDLMARFGGGVLVVYLPHTDPIGALDVAERVRERVASFRLNWNGQPVGATVSIGVASIGPDHAALDAVIADAGTALREAKAAGRNCVRAAPVQPRRAPAAGSSVGGHRAAGKA
ncbi:GGDEF domain-containing protein [Aquabacterium sp.]|uniref:GGDEF domain-containing protein n=1 Tax=Aquabacterium sp. TaxID=1872578 RepID=UPI002C8C169F|nr:GGDEF domain-containing protein [Aquabacterium sp.]HSW08665.1 GGDEF domain-containing protein [Aquabacterium sp.]